MKLDLKRVWEVMNTLSYRQAILAEEEDKYVELLGHSSNYCQQEFDSFLNYYSFKVDGEHIVVFNTDPIPYEDYDNDDFSYIPSVLLSFSAEKLNKWIETEIELQLKKQQREKIAEKENIKRQIEQLNKRLNNL
jgi:hypothetical protein